MIALNLYSVRVGNVGSFFVAAVDQAQARAIGEQWKAEKGIAPSCVVRIDHFSDHRVVYAPGV